MLPEGAAAVRPQQRRPRFGVAELAGHPREEAGDDPGAQLRWWGERQLEPGRDVVGVDEELVAAHGDEAAGIGHARGVERADLGAGGRGHLGEDRRARLRRAHEVAHRRVGVAVAHERQPARRAGREVRRVQEHRVGDVVERAPARPVEDAGANGPVGVAASGGLEQLVAHGRRVEQLRGPHRSFSRSMSTRRRAQPCRSKRKRDRAEVDVVVVGDLLGRRLDRARSRPGRRCRRSRALSAREARRRRRVLHPQHEPPLDEPLRVVVGVEAE